MAQYESVLACLSKNKDVIIDLWERGLNEAFPEFYKRGTMMKQAQLYFDYTLELNIPKEDHPIQTLVKTWSKVLVTNNIPYRHIFRSSSYWRNAVFKVLEKDHAMELDSVLCFLSRFDERISYFQEMMCEEYWELTSMKLRDQEHAITQLHDDRLNLIGKMAASMAHEIRNPLTSIRGFLKLIRENITNENGSKVSRYLNVVENEFENIHMQITGLLSFSKRRVIEEPCVQVTPRQLLDSVISLLNPRFLNENVNLVIGHIEEELLTVQKVAVQQVISNIINNGLDALSVVKYDKEMIIGGYVNQGQYIIEFTNNGPAIREDIQKTLFEPFVTDKVEGTGLGLAICKTIMQKNNGGISFISKDDRTTFTLSFRMSGAPEPQLAEHE